MPIRSLKNKINDIASGEILGETTAEQEKRKHDTEAKAKARAEAKLAKKEKLSETKGKSVKIKKEKPVKTKKEKHVKEKIEKGKVSRPNKRQDKEEKISKDTLFKKKDNEEENEEIIDEIIVKDSEEGYEDVLAILNIDENLNLEVDFMSDDLDYVEFSTTTPLGFDFDEVTDFISRAKYTLNKYESALLKRNKEIIKIASEVKKVERKMIEQNHARELNKIIGGMTEEERLIEENTELRIELRELESKFVEGKSNSHVVSRLENEIKSLRTENEMLIMDSIQPESESKLPSFEGFDKAKEESVFKQSSLPVMPSYEEENEPYDIFDEILSKKNK